MRLIGDRLLVRPIKEKVLESGIIIPRQANNQFRAKVIMTGVNVKKVREGDIVVYHEFSGEPWPLDNNLMLLRESKDIKSYLRLENKEY